MRALPTQRNTSVFNQKRYRHRNCNQSSMKLKLSLVEANMKSKRGTDARKSAHGVRIRQFQSRALQAALPSRAQPFAEDGYRAQQYASRQAWSGTQLPPGDRVMGLDREGALVILVSSGINGRWDVSEKGSEKPLASFNDKEDAYAYANDLTRSSDDATVLIEEDDEEGFSPMPPLSSGSDASNGGVRN